MIEHYNTPIPISAFSRFSSRFSSARLANGWEDHGEQTKDEDAGS
jgi:hypothetical protein